MTFISYQQINALEQFPLIAGSYFVLEFSVYEQDGVTPQDIGGSTITWVLSPYGQPDYNILQLVGSITGTNTFTVTLESTDTETLPQGKYIQQPVIVDFSGKEFRPAQGIILIQAQTPLA